MNQHDSHFSKSKIDTVGGQSEVGSRELLVASVVIPLYSSNSRAMGNNDDL
jgi:hypothetical protein